ISMRRSRAATIGAEQGTLAIMAGGTPAAFERVASIFAALGRATLVGPVGSGQLAKLAQPGDRCGSPLAP
ncbi:MAG: NAD(P)-binding domain-containing protein, partial [Stellaceae bacterium]